MTPGPTTMRLANLARRHALPLGFLAVLAPLALLLALQYRWLVKLDETSALAQQKQLDNYLEGVAADVKWLYSTKMERALNLPSPLFTEGKLEKVAYFFRKETPPGVRRLLAASFAGPEKGELRHFDPKAGCWYEPGWSDEERAIWIAISPWSTQAHKGAPLEKTSLVVEERDPRSRILLFPITDETSQVVGITGLILDEAHFRTAVLPAAIEHALPKYFGGHPADDFVVTVRDRGGVLVYTTDPKRRLREEAKKPFSLVFTDWTMGLASRHATIAEVAHRSFGVNIGLSALLATVLLGGVVLALRSASRAVKLSAMKSDFVSNVSHELRTPLASIRVFGELLRLGRVESLERAREYG
ncbi:MAG TPA: histidine kinase dimerization/phospho-acceptor domain-containing protein, partial [Thermoanaerobaculia bacterium]